MKILIATDWYEPVVNGVVASVKNLRKELIARGHDVRILTLYAGKNQPRMLDAWYLPSLPAGAVYPNARVSLLPRTPLLSPILRWSPDIIHTQCEFSTFYYARRLSEMLNIPIVHTYHTVYEDYTHYFPPANYSVHARNFGQKAVGKFSEFVCRRSERVIVPTEKTKNILIKYGITTPIAVIPSGIDLDKYFHKPSVGVLEKKRRELGLEGKKVCIFLGRMAKEKNNDELMRYFARMNLSDTVLLMVGGGPYIDELKDMASKLRANIIFTGMVPPEQTPLYYSLADVFVCASTSETQGMTYAEAMASGLPCICRKDPCIEGVIVDGDNGWQYEDEQQFAAYLKQVLGDEQLQRTMSRRSGVASQRYSSRTFAENVEKEYLAALTKDGARNERIAL